jgi:ADP-ribose pyrophosphatase YjhB (NUDIX family)
MEEPVDEPQRSPRLRRAVRALVVRGDDAVLLVHFRFVSGNEVWALPGGGIEAGESVEDAIRRELAEEVGVHRFELGPEVWTRTHVFELSPEFDGQHERVFLVRLGEPPGEPGLTVDELRAESVDATRWWTTAELTASRELFAPRGLPELVARLLADGPPDGPWDVGA